MTDDRGRLIRERLGGPEYAALFRAVRRRLEERGEGGARTVTLDRLSEGERQALADLHGWPRLPGSRVRISLEKLDGLLRRSAVAGGLVETVVALGGPLGDRRSAREAAARREGQLWAGAWDRAAGARPELPGWIEDLRGRGLVHRLARASGHDAALLLQRALDIAVRLPARGIPLSVLSAEATGDAHALDPGRPLATLVLRAASRIAGWPKPPSTAGGARRLWAEVGVTCDPLSAQVLVLGVRASGVDWLSRQLRECAEAGAPRRLTLRDLAGAALLDASEQAVLVCENPVVVAAAADRLGSRCGPLVCVEGVPSTAALLLLRRIRQAGAPITFHADFDWGGVRIGNQLAAQFGAGPWRFCAGDYKAGLAAAPEAVALEGRAVDAAWDPELSLAMTAAGRALFEEQVLEALLSDLAR